MKTVEDLDTLRRTLLGQELYNRCENPGRNPVTYQDLSNRLQYLNNKNCLQECDEDDLAKFCGLKEGEVRQNCQVASVNPRNLDCVEERNQFFSERKTNGCVICFEDFSVENPPVMYGACGHTYHKSCLDQLPNDRCPECRGTKFTIYRNRAEIQEQNRQIREFQQFYQMQEERFPRVNLPANTKNLRLSHLLEHIRRMNESDQYAEYLTNLVAFFESGTPEVYLNVAQNTLRNELNHVEILIVLMIKEARRKRLLSALMKYLREFCMVLLQRINQKYLDLFRRIQKGIRDSIKYYAMQNAPHMIQILQEGLIVQDNPFMSVSELFDWLLFIANQYLEGGRNKREYLETLHQHRVDFEE